MAHDHLLVLSGAIQLKRESQHHHLAIFLYGPHQNKRLNPLLLMFHGSNCLIYF